MHLTTPVLHIHPTLLCNLRCGHCYSGSGPEHSSALDPMKILAFAEILADKGYHHASISGGEPTVYGPILELCTELKKLKYSVAIISNGLLKSRLKILAGSGSVASISISFDGNEAMHNSIRGRPDCFSTAMNTLTDLSAMSANAGVILAVTKPTIREVPKLCRQFVDAGAKHIQIHPISAVGRAIDEPNNFLELDEHELLKLLVISQLLNSAHPDVTISCDAVTKQQLSLAKTAKLGDAISPIVVTPSGSVLPITYNISSDFELGLIGEKDIDITYDQKLTQLALGAKGRCLESTASTFYSELSRISHVKPKPLGCALNSI